MLFHQELIESVVSREIASKFLSLTSKILLIPTPTFAGAHILVVHKPSVALRLQKTLYLRMALNLTTSGKGGQFTVATIIISAGTVCLILTNLVLVVSGSAGWITARR